MPFSYTILLSLKNLIHFFLKTVLARARLAAACRGVLGAYVGGDGAAATLALRFDPGLKNIDFLLSGTLL